MVFPIIRVSKFIGTIGLGLLTGLSYSLSSITLPSLLHLPTAPLASQSHSYIKSRSKSIQKYLTYISSTALLAAYFLAPRRARHPYLLYTSFLLLAGASNKVSEYLAVRISPPQPLQTPSSQDAASPTTKGRVDSELAESTVMVGHSNSSIASEGEEHSQDVNGEIVRQSVEKQRVVESIRAGIWGMGFALGVVGIWGDGA